MPRSWKLFAGVLIAQVAAVAPSGAQETPQRSILSPDEVRATVARHAETTSARRSALQAFLDAPAVRDIASSVGIDIRDVRSAANTLSDDELRSLQPRIERAEDALAGGDTFVISSTAVIIGLLVIILIIVA